MHASQAGENGVPPFSRSFFQSEARIARIGDGSIGGKAQGLASIDAVLSDRFGSEPQPGLRVTIPRLVVLATSVFDKFMDRNDLWDLALSGEPDDQISLAFQRAVLPTEILGDLQSIVDQVRVPLAVRSSSRLEDALFRPFAGVYETKMIPNNHPEARTRFLRLTEAIKFVYASTFLRSAKSYIRATEHESRDEKMAVIIQEVVGIRHGERFYPDLSAVARSFNFYPIGRSRPEEGVVNLALGLGKTIVDGGLSWPYSPARPKAPPPFGSTRELLEQTQLDFWAVNLGRPPAFDPTKEAEYLVRADLQAADYDGTLRYVASTLDERSGRVVPGVGVDGPRIVNFAPLLVMNEIPLNPALRQLLELAEEHVGQSVEVELALTIDRKGAPTAHIGFLQVRPMVVTDALVEVTDEEMRGEQLVVGSRRVMGNGVVESIHDIVFVDPQTFETKHTQAIARELEALNAKLFDQGTDYLLIGFGRWGSSDPWLGIPAEWGQICGAKVIVEATLPSINIEPSQGSHFFHNITSFNVSYFFVHHERDVGIDWGWLTSLPVVEAKQHVRHARTDQPLKVKVDGRTGRGCIRRHGPA
jgi:hypothetical protein